MYPLTTYQARSKISQLAKFLVHNPIFLVVLGIAIFAFILRTVNLGDRAMHHDESLHAEFAWRYLVGLGYQHDPMMHGPLLFNLIGAAFYLFGDSEFTARLPFALAGSCLVLSIAVQRKTRLGRCVCVCPAFIDIALAALLLKIFSQ